MRVTNPFFIKCDILQIHELAGYGFIYNILIKGLLMALRQADQLRLEGIQDTISTLVDFNIEKSAILEKIQDKISAFEADTKTQLKFTITNGKAEFSLVDLKSDFIRTRQNPDKTMTSLRAKIQGLGIEIKIEKDGVSFSNEEVSEALGELQSIVSQMPVEMIEQPHKDWPRLPGEDVYTGDDEEPEESVAVAPVAPSQDLSQPVSEQPTSPDTQAASVQTQSGVQHTPAVESGAATSPVDEFPGEQLDSPIQENMPASNPLV